MYENAQQYVFNGIKLRHRIAGRDSDGVGGGIRDQRGGRQLAEHHDGAGSGRSDRKAGSEEI